MTKSEQTDQAATESIDVLVIEDTSLLLKMCRNFLERHGYRAHTAGDGDGGLQILQQVSPAIVILDLGLPDVHGLDLLAEIKELRPQTEVIVMTAKGTVDNAVTAMRLGACDFITKPIDFEALERSLRIAGRAVGLMRENTRLRSLVDTSAGLTGLIGESSAMQDLKRLIERVAPTQETCLITGENGTGKEVVARSIHRLSRRADMQFIPVNCGALTESLIESELFGHVKGAFSGAEHARQGCFRQAEGGTLFLDEIGDMPLPMQVKLLRALENREITPVGADVPIPIDIRVVAATNADLMAGIEAGTFREDLFYRLNVITLELPPLRERTSDIPLLIEHLLDRQGHERTVSTAAMSALEAWSWAGNIRELQNVLRRAVVLCDKTIEPEHLPTRMIEHAPPPQDGPVDPDTGRLTLMTLDELEFQVITLALATFGGDRGRSAKALGIDRTTLYRKIKRLQADGRLVAEQDQATDDE